MKDFSSKSDVGLDEPDESVFRALLSQRRLYRTALILGKSTTAANELLRETHLKARQEYAQLDPGAHLGLWLSQLLIDTYLAIMARKTQ